MLTRKTVIGCRLLPAGLSGCSADSSDVVREEVARCGTPDMDLEQAIHAVRQAGFVCVEAPRSGNEVPDIRCSRTKSHRLLATCVQHVMLHRSADPITGPIVTVAEPACAGI